MDRPDRPHRRGLSPDVDPGLRADPTVAALVDRCAFPAGPLALAVSGGPDSLALLVLARATGVEVTAIHVDHGLREGSAAEADVVADAAQRFGASFRAETVVVEAGPNLEARARDARFAVLPADVCTGHTADDRAETMLLNLLRGAGPTGLGAMGPSPRRPILDLRRSETVALCERLGLTPVQDPSNLDPTFRRNRVRHDLLPLLGDVGDRDPVPVLVRQGDLFAEQARDLDALGAAVDPTDATALRAAVPSVARAAIRRWLLTADVADGHPVDAASVERVRAVAAHEIEATEVTGGWRVARTAGRLRLEPPRDRR
jgi:tRNA(Ile)-lysidine synthase